MTGTLTLVFKGEVANFGIYRDGTEKSAIIQRWEKLYTKGMIAKCELRDDMDPVVEKTKDAPELEKSNYLGKAVKRKVIGEATVKLNRSRTKLRYPRYDY